MRLLACQIDIAWEDRRANHARARALLEGARSGASVAPRRHREIPSRTGHVTPGAACSGDGGVPQWHSAGALVILPEMFATGFSMDVEKTGGREAAETEGFLRELASRYDCTVAAGVVSGVAGDVVGGAGGRFFNEALVVSASGEELARYRKMHLFTPAGEDEHYCPGDAPVVFDCAGFRAAPFICYDLRFPEVFRRAAGRHADLFLVIANWPAERLDHWETLLRARAIENQAYVVGVNRTGRDPRNDYPGRSMIVAPGGEVLAQAGPEECVLSVDLDPAVVERARREFPALRDMRRGGA